jgi:ABC-type glycerol-3-phosphate transport system substrate-binding protein
MILLLVTGLLMVAIGGVSGQDSVTLVIWGEPGTVTCINEQSTDTGCIYAVSLNQLWSEMYPNITLQWEDHGWDVTLRQNLVTAQLGGTAPDITVGESFMPEFTRNGSLLPLAISEDALANLVPGTVAAVTQDGVPHGVAAFTAVFALEVNADVVRAAGLDPDTLELSTWSDVLATAAAINEAGAGEYHGFSILGPTAFPAAALFRAAPYVYQTGAAFCDEGCENPTFNDPRAVKVYQWFRDLYQYTPPGLAFNGDEGFVFTRLFNGETAMQTAGAWHPSWARGSGCEDCRYLPLPIPDEDGQRANVVVGNAIYAALSSTQHPEEAMLFLEFLASDAVQNNNFWANGRMPATLSALEIILDVADGDTSAVPDYYEGDAVAAAQPFRFYIDELFSGDVRTLPAWQREGAALDALWNDMFAEVLTSDRPVEEILDEFQAEAEALLQ